MASREPFHELRTALWHLRNGGLPQVREWRSRKPSSDELVEIITQLKNDQRNLVRKIDDLEKVHKTAERQITSLSKENQRIKVSAFANATMLGLDPQKELALDGRSGMAKQLLASGQILPLLKLAGDNDVLEKMTLTQLRTLSRNLNSSGYWGLLVQAQKQISKKSGNNSDQSEFEKSLAILSVFKDPLYGLQQRQGPVSRVGGPVLHVVGKGLLDTQTGYTLRTAYTLRAQLDIGIPGLVAIQPGGGAKAVEKLEHTVFRGVEYVRLPGKPRARSFLNEWLSEFVAGLEELIVQEEPSVLHAHSDFLNGAAAILAGRKHHIPVVYESRGFWEESWLSRLSDRLGLGLDPSQALEPFGLPEAFALRKHAEEQVRAEADVIITLADVMKEHIEANHVGERELSVSVVPNAVDASSFYPQAADGPLARSLRIREDTIVVGYVTSMVEYEGVDVLLRGFAELLQYTDQSRVHLLLVGDGPVLSRLKHLATTLGIDSSVTFTGQVSHDSIVSYYSLIDIFVVPRRPTRVSNLVTPLKPFEAMAMAKPLVVSGVTALREIAEKSQAAHTFAPNDHGDLAQTLLELVEDAALRNSLGERAREWVTGERPWTVNAEKNLEVYRELGVNWHDLEEMRSDSVRDRIHTFLQNNPPPREGWFVLGRPKDTANTIMEEGWKYNDFPRVKLDQRIDWNVYPQIDRSMAFWLQSWFFIDSFFLDGRNPSLQEVQFLLEVIKQWNDARLMRGQAPEDDESMAYYDMALALRAPRLLAVISVADKFEETRENVWGLIELLLHERQALREKWAFTSNTNHGFYTAASQLHLEKFLPGLVDSKHVQSQAKCRMSMLIKSQFANDGGHLEHSPTYHRLLLESFITAVDQGLIQDPATVERLHRAEHNFGWMIQPNGELVPIGDSEATQQTLGVATRDPSAEWIITDGDSGKPIESEMLTLRESGYVFVRSPQPVRAGERIASSYLAFQAGFHSRAHKHADDLSFVWFDKGQELLIDAGKWGYGPLLPTDSPLREQGFYYSAPERQYVESVRAHNTVEIDGNIHDRKRPRYGSSIVEATSNSGTFKIVASVPHIDYVHERELLFTPREEVVVNDTIKSTHDSDRHASAWFLLNGALELRHQNDFELHFDMKNGDILQVTSSALILQPVRGQKNPLVGWRSDKTNGLVPAWSVRAVKNFSEHAKIQTTFKIVRA